MISLCVIAKNEEHCIGAMLESVRTVVGEAIVVDTGSTDSTQAVAQAHGARVFQHGWNNDFAAARNISLSYAQYPWILVLDADEELSPDSISILDELVRGERLAYFLDRHHFFATPNAATISRLAPEHPAVERGAHAFFATHDIRLFPNEPSIQFTGEVHESAEDSLRTLGYRIDRSKAVIFHFGHLIGGARAQEKKDLYLSLAQQKASTNPRDWRAWYHVGVELQTQGRHLEAMQAFSRGVQMRNDFAPLWRQIGVSLCEQGDYSTAFEAFTKALSKDQTCPLTWNALGVAFLQVHSLDAAKVCFETILAGDTGNPTARMNLELVKQLRTLT
jgi:tetratricopeptide (TPR) repeat protein